MEREYPEYRSARWVATRIFHAGDDAATLDDKEREIQNQMDYMRRQARRGARGPFPHARKFGRNWWYNPVDLEVAIPEKKENRLMRLLAK